MLMTHGAAWLALKAEDPVAARARSIGSVTGIVAIVGYALAGLWLAFGMQGYAIVGEVVTDGPSNPLFSEVTRTSTWLIAYADRPWIVIAPILAFLGMIMTVRDLRADHEVATLLWSQLGIFGTISSVGLTMFPFILPSSIDPKSSLTAWDSSSSHTTLFIMLVATVIFLPIVLAYTAWVYKVLWGKVTAAEVTGSSDSVY